MIRFNLKFLLCIFNFTIPWSCLGYILDIVEIQVGFNGLSYTNREQ